MVTAGLRRRSVPAVGGPESPPARRDGGRLRIALRTVAFAGPATAIMVLVLLLPSIQSVRFSLFDWNGVGDATWVGLGNYRELWSDSAFRGVLGHSLTLAVLGTIGSVAAGLLWAYGIERRLPGWRAHRFLLFVPVVMPVTVSALLWALLLDTTGPVNALLSEIGLSTPPDWLGDYRIALWVVVLVAIWQASGFTMLLLLSAMEDVPAELHDAASLDGATSLRRLVSIVVPSIRGTLLTVTVVQFVGLLKAFDIVFALTRGGPGGATDVLGTYLTQKAFSEGRYGYGSAVAVAMTLILLVINLVLYRWLLGKEDR